LHKQKICCKANNLAADLSSVRFSNSDLSFSSYRLRLLLEEKLAAQLTDEVCRKKLRFQDSFRQIRNLSTSSAPSGHLLLKEKALTCANTKLTDKSKFDQYFLSDYSITTLSCFN